MERFWIQIHPNNATRNKFQYASSLRYPLPAVEILAVFRLVNDNFPLARIYFGEHPVWAYIKTIARRMLVPRLEPILGRSEFVVGDFLQLVLDTVHILPAQIFECRFNVFPEGNVVVHGCVLTTRDEYRTPGHPEGNCNLPPAFVAQPYRDLRLESRVVLLRIYMRVTLTLNLRETR